MHLLHRTIPFIAIAALVTALPAGAQAREDSTSNSGSVMSLLGLGANFVGLGSTEEERSSTNAWSCAGGCRSFGARGSHNASFGQLVSSVRLSKHADAESKEKSRRSPLEQADLSDYGWSRRLGADGAPLDPVRSKPTDDIDVDGMGPDKLAKGVLSSASPDGVGQAPSWVAPGSSPAAAPVSAAAARGDDIGTTENGPTAASAASAPLVGPMSLAGPQFSAAAVSLNNVAPLVTTVPEPSSVVLLAVGMSSLLFLRIKRSRRQ